MYLENINGPEDVKKLGAEARKVLAQEIRDNLLVMESKHGGHFGPNFGIVEATIALHTVFNSPADHIVYDVSHQTYPHKMLTGRKQAYMDPALYDSVSPCTDPAETPHDLFKIGHTSTSAWRLAWQRLATSWAAGRTSSQLSATAPCPAVRLLKV